jgi:DNA-binding MarR family transcriptional regulator
VFHGTRPTTEVRRERMLKAAARGEQHYTKLRPEAVRRGSAHGNAKLTPEGYDEAVALLRRGTLSQKEIANLLGVSQAQISDINTGKRPR